MRSFWLPVAVSYEVAERNGPPLRLKILGEDLVLFRDSEGRVGLVDESCPHRLSSLFFGRNEDCGIRCIYHGWKFDVTGACVDMPSEPPSSKLKNKIKLKAYPTHEAGGLIWAYMGTQDTAPQFPQFDWADLPESHRYASRWEQDSNYLQALEGEFDTGHVGFLHSSLDDFDESPFSLNGIYVRGDLVPKWEIIHTPTGMTAASYRNVDETKVLWRWNQFLLPVFSMPSEEQHKPQFIRIWLPRDDISTSVICVSFRYDRPVADNELTEWRAGISHHRDVVPGTTRPIAHAGNDYLIDREKQRTKTYSGIEGVRNQDAAAVESQGRIVDRTREHLGTSDAGVIQLRKCLMRNVRNFLNGEHSQLLTDGSLYRLKSGQILAPAHLRFEELSGTGGSRDLLATIND
uniref:Rieske [2Fe-2S] domain protein n=3 Tax=Rhizobium rhizogenes TaxID=359 RepID=A0A7S5DRM1_RHIRH|nr:rieske [2Fe-2S] domain protein [Rhizobium rhizogenes]